MIKLAFDIDGTLADVIQALRQRARRDWGITFDPTTISRHDFFEQICQVGYFEPFLDYFFSILEHHWTGIAPYPDTELLSEFEPVTFITARRHGLLPATQSWIEHNFPSLVYRIYQSRSKHKADLLVKLGLDGIVEDRLQTANQVAEKGLICYLINRPWNMGRWTHPDVVRVDSLRDILNGQKEKQDNLRCEPKGEGQSITRLGM